MRHNHRQKASNILDRYDRVYIDIPQCPWLHSIVAVPLKAIYYNTGADESANIDQVFRSVYELERFAERYRVELG